MKGKLDLPGGFIDPMETAEEALRREVSEELNLTLKTLRFYTSTPNQYDFAGVRYYTLDLAYICTVESFEEIEANEEIEDIIFLSPNQIDLEEIGLISIQEIVKKYITQSGT